jgi:hypothetical protein
MKHLKKLFIDLILEFVEAMERTANLFRKKSQPSLLAINIDWCTHSEWMDRLVAYKQLNLWTLGK